jgi:lipid A 4'-phosphatase
MFSKLFFSEIHNKFYLANNSFLKFISKFAFLLAFLILSYVAISILKTFIKTKSFRFEIYKPQIIVLLVFLIGNLIVVQLYSKPNFARARPIKVKEFHGHLAFSPAFEISNQCKNNCSFVSFHTSIGMLFLIYSFCHIGKRREVMIAISLLFTVFLVLMRISQCKHFLSDVVISACFMMITYHFIIMLCGIYNGKKYKSSIYDANRN